MATLPPYYQMGIPSGIPGSSTEAVSTYAGTGSLMYQSMMPQSHAFPHHLDASSQGLQERFIKPDDIQASRHHHPSVASTSAVPSTHVASSMRSRQPEKSPASAAAGTTIGVKSSPLSLASITSPFYPDPQPHQSKNYHAQMLKLGERLRTGSHQPLEGPAIHYEMIRRRLLLRSRLGRPRSQGRRQTYMATLLCNRQEALSCLFACSRNHHHRLEDLSILPFLQFCLSETRIESH